MSFFEALWAAAAPALPPALTVIGTVGVALIVRFLLRRVSRTRESLPFRRQIASFLVVLAGVFAFVVALPIDREIRAQILSVLGVLLSAIIALSSTSFVGNAMAGLMLRIVGGYRPGDFVRVGDVLGRVSDQGLFHTEIQTIRRDLVSVPNLYMTQHPVHVTRSGGTFVSATVSLGFDVGHGDAEAALLSAAEAADLKDPFVMVNAILDHAVEYEVYGLLEETKHLLTSRSTLRKAVLDSLHATGIEVLSPQFVNRREYGADMRFVPESTGHVESSGGATDHEEESNAEELAFDKADEAESIERLKSLRDRLVAEKGEVGEKLKEKERGDRDSLRRKSEELDGKIDRVTEIIQAREEERTEPEADGP